MIFFFGFLSIFCIFLYVFFIKLWCFGGIIFSVFCEDFLLVLEVELGEVRDVDVNEFCVFFDMKWFFNFCLL